jgi:hypothetical protein
MTIVNGRLAIGCGVFSSLLFATELFAYPTIWTISNRTRLPVTVSCQSDELEGLDGDQADFATSVIAPGLTYSHNWGHSWYNDGAGLNAGVFTCRGTVESDSRSVREFRFKTRWDESVVISVSNSGGQVVLSK